MSDDLSDDEQATINETSGQSNVMVSSQWSMGEWNMIPSCRLKVSWLKRLRYGDGGSSMFRFSRVPVRVRAEHYGMSNQSIVVNLVKLGVIY
jgi:hypothetical protein